MVLYSAGQSLMTRTTIIIRVLPNIVNHNIPHYQYPLECIQQLDYIDFKLAIKPIQRPAS
jgi:hypothetical protein